MELLERHSGRSGHGWTMLMVIWDSMMAIMKGHMMIPKLHFRRRTAGIGGDHPRRSTRSTRDIQSTKTRSTRGKPRSATTQLFTIRTKTTTAMTKRPSQVLTFDDHSHLTLLRSWSPTNTPLTTSHRQIMSTTANTGDHDCPSRNHMWPGKKMHTSSKTAAYSEKRLQAGATAVYRGRSTGD